VIQYECLGLVVQILGLDQSLTYISGIQYTLLYWTYTQGQRSIS